MNQIVNLEKEHKKLNNICFSTRYQGSKRRVLSWIYTKIRKIDFNSALDAFGGSGSVSYLFKLMNKDVCYNDILDSNRQSALALIKNSNTSLSNEDIQFLFSEDIRFNYKKIISNHYEDIYFLSVENKELDIYIQNVERLNLFYSGNLLALKKAIAYHCIFQGCLSKRPFNIFHRKNLNLRTADVKRNFGNKKTWEKSFLHFVTFFNEEVKKKTFLTSRNIRVLSDNIFDLKFPPCDLVYLDPPYTRPHEEKPKDYSGMYHFLEGIMDYQNWENKINNEKNHKPYKTSINSFVEGNIEESFDKLFMKFRESTIVLSYSNYGKPSKYKIKKLLKKYKKKVRCFETPYNYKLNKKNGHQLKEMLVIGIDT
jgi:adenine-specific DNA-methyltransferase